MTTCKAFVGGVLGGLGLVSFSVTSFFFFSLLSSFSFLFFFFCAGVVFQPKVQKGTSKGMQNPSPITDEENHLIHSSLFFSALGTLIIQLILRALWWIPRAFKNTVSGTGNGNLKISQAGLIEFYPGSKFWHLLFPLGPGEENLPWGSEGWFIKSELSAEVLSKSDSDLFGFVTIKVSGDSYLSYGILDKLAEQSGQSRGRMVFSDPSYGQRTGNHSPNHKHAQKSRCCQDFSVHPEFGHLWLRSMLDLTKKQVWVDSL